MTLVLTCVTENNLIQVSDRRLTWPDGTHKDVAAKTTSVCGHGLIGYTGLAMIGAENTGMWFARTARLTKSQPELLDHLKQGADQTISTLPLPDHIKRLTFVGAIWIEVEGVLRPFFMGLSNAFGDLSFKRQSEPAPLKNGFSLYAFGAALTMGENADIRRDIRRRVAKGDRPAELLELLVRLLRRVSGRTPTVGKAAIGASLPRTCIPARYVRRAGAPDYSKEIFQYFPDGKWDSGEWYGPNLACGGQAITDPVSSNKTEDEDWFRKHGGPY